jgi:hypothetical protein
MIIFAIDAQLKRHSLDNFFEMLIAKSFLSFTIPKTWEITLYYTCIKRLIINCHRSIKNILPQQGLIGTTSHFMTFINSIIYKVIYHDIEYMLYTVLNVLGNEIGDHIFMFIKSTWKLFYLHFETYHSFQNCV